MQVFSIISGLLENNSILKKDVILQNTDIDQTLITIFLSVISIFLAFGEDVSNLKYQKKYISICYFTIFVEVTFFENSILFIAFTFIMISLISGINLAYQSDNLEKELGRVKLVIYKITEWFFITKSYIYWVCILLLFLVISFIPLLNHYVSKGICIVIIMISFIYHLSSNMVDKFNIKSFDSTRDCILNSRKSFDDMLSINSDNGNLFSILGFLLYMEDKDYFSRNEPVISFRTIVKRKFGIDFRINNIVKICNLVGGYTKEFIIEKAFSDSEVKGVKKVCRIFCAMNRFTKYAIRRYFRGYSTIETQFFRSIVITPTAFQYTVRRKIFVEIIYSNEFFCAWKTFIKRISMCKHDDECINYIKVCILKGYYKEVLKHPGNYCELISRFKSRLSTNTYYDFLEIYKQGEMESYVNMIKEHFKQADDFYKSII